MLSLESMISQASIVRLLDVFVDILDLEALGFVVKGKIKNGAPAYHSADLLKLYYYGYFNRVRSSRRLERECQLNMEAMWLMRGCQPGYKTIANFRKDNAKALVLAFKRFNQFLLDQDLFDKTTVAIDGSKFRGQNSKKNNYNEKKINQHLDYIDRQTKEYLEVMNQMDKEEEQAEFEESEINRGQRIALSNKLDHLDKRRKKYTVLQEKAITAREKGQTQISTTDPDARALPKKMNIVEVGYNVLTAAEAKNKFITNFEVSNESDTYALSGVAMETKEVLGMDQSERLTALADKGFDTGCELKKCAEQNIQTVVAPRKRMSYKKNKDFAKSKFLYEEDADYYICPQQQRLTTNGTWYEKKAYKRHRANYKFQRYTCSYNICKNCPFKEDCVGQSNLKNSKGKFIERSEYEEYIQDNIERYHLNKDLYRQRQALVEHQFGTIKRQWGYDYTLLKTMEKVTGEFAIIFTCYNLRRSVSILGVSELIKRLKAAFSLFFDHLPAIVSRFSKGFAKWILLTFTPFNFLKPAYGKVFAF